MRKVTFGGAVSLDGYLARRNNAVDWLMWSDEAATVMNEYWPKVDTILMGRKTYDAAVENQPEGGGGNPYGDIRTYIFSRTLIPGSVSGAEIISENAGEFVRSLKEQDGKEICVMGGGDLARSLFEADVIDEIGFNIHPVLLGSGISAFHEMKGQIDLELIECRQFGNGCIYVLCRVKH